MANYFHLNGTTVELSPDYRIVDYVHIIDSNLKKGQAWTWFHIAGGKTFHFRLGEQISYAFTAETETGQEL